MHPSCRLQGIHKQNRTHRDLAEAGRALPGLLLCCFGDVVLNSSCADRFAAHNFNVHIPLPGIRKYGFRKVYTGANGRRVEYLYISVFRRFNLQLDFGLNQRLVKVVRHINFERNGRPGLQHGFRFKTNDEISFMPLLSWQEHGCGKKKSGGSFHALILAVGLRAVQAYLHATL